MQINYCTNSQYSVFIFIRSQYIEIDNSRCFNVGNLVVGILLHGEGGM